MFCPNCGTQNEDINAKCQKCGFALKGASAPKFKGTMLMMNAPPGVIPAGKGPAVAPPAAAVPVTRSPSTPPAPGGFGVAPGAPTAPKKNLAKATMIGVAPPSPGAVAPPRKPSIPDSAAVPSSTDTRTAISPSYPPTPAAQQDHLGAPAPRPAPVNPFGGTMLMGAVPPGLGQPPHAGSAPAVSPPIAEQAPIPSDRTVASAGVPAQASADNPSWSSTTPSVSPLAPTDAPPAPAVHPGPAHAMATEAFAAAPAPVELVPPTPGEGGAYLLRDAAPESAPIQPITAKPSLFLNVVFGVLTLGIFPLVKWLRGRRSGKDPLGIHQ